MNVRRNESGIAHLAMIGIVIVVIAAIGFAGWRVMQKSDTTTDSSKSAEKTSSKEVEAECKKEIDDKDLCKMFSNWNSKKFSVVSTDTSEGETSKSTIIFDDGKTYMKTEAAGTGNWEVISIGQSTYTKAGNTWYKSTIKQQTDENVKADDFTLDEPDESQPEAERTRYEKQGKEACGNLTCFKYKVIEPSSPETTQFIWFDDKDYLLRKSTSESTDGSKSEQIYSYDNISVKEPSPVKDLAPNQYIMPGQTEPVTIPGA